MLLCAFPMPSLPGLVAESSGQPRGPCRTSCPFSCHTRALKLPTCWYGAC